MRSWLVWLLVAALLSPSTPATATGAVRYVATSGADAGACTSPAAPCRSLQYAVEQSQPGDEIRVAGGVYSGVQTVAAIEYSFTQVVFIDHSLTVLGGYRVSDWNTAQPASNPTVIDAGGVGRGLTAVDVNPNDMVDVSVTLAGLTLTGGNYSDLGTSVAWPDSCPRANSDCGGGLYARDVQLIVRDSILRDNTANDSGGTDPARRGDGGGAMLVNLAAGSRLERVTMIANEATAATGQGGGLYVSGGADLTVTDSQFVGNRARAGGAAVYLRGLTGPVTLRSIGLEENEVEGANGSGGALAVVNTSGSVRLERMRVVDNTSAARSAGLSIINSGLVEVINVLLWNNRSLDPDRSSLLAVTGGGPSTVRVIHATAVDNATQYVLLGTSTSGAQTVAMTNTVVVSATAAVAADVAGGSMTVSVSHVVFSDVADPITTLDGSPSTQIGLVIAADPVLDGSFRPVAGSPAIDAGAQAGVPNDYFGQARVGAPDIGYAESAASPTPTATRTVTAPAVGSATPSPRPTAEPSPSRTPTAPDPEPPSATPGDPWTATATASLTATAQRGSTTPPSLTLTRTATATTTGAAAGTLTPAATNDRQPQDRPLRVWLPAITNRR